MENFKISDLEPRFLEPQGIEWGGLELNDESGAVMRYAKLEHQGANKGNILILQGFSEFIQKYFELMRDLSGAGYTVFSFDWRGQGKSTRFLKKYPMRPYSMGFERDILDMKHFIEAVMPKGEEKHVFAHSMGGHLALRFLHDNPTVFERAVLSAPMLGFKLPASRGIILTLIRFLRLIGRDVMQASKGGAWSDKNIPLENDPRSHDKMRRLVQYVYALNTPDLRMDNASFGWVYQAIRSLNMLEGGGYLETLTTPILIGIAENEEIVDNAAIERIAERLKNAECMTLKDSRHEIFMERDEIRDVFLRQALLFIENQG